MKKNKKEVNYVKEAYLAIIFAAVLVFGANLLADSLKKTETKAPEVIVRQTKVTNNQCIKRPPCKLSIHIKKDGVPGTPGIPDFVEYLLDGDFCEKLAETSQTTYGFENGEVFLEMYKLPRIHSDNFYNRTGWPQEKINLEQFTELYVESK